MGYEFIPVNALDWGIIIGFLVFTLVVGIIVSTSIITIILTFVNL